MVDFLQKYWHWSALAAVSGIWLLIDQLRIQGDKTKLSSIETTMMINREDAIIVDIRDIGEYTKGHLPNARHIPATDLEKRAGELEKFKASPIILYCASGQRTAAAVKVLGKAGFEKLFQLRGGFYEWEKSGQPITRKKK